MAISALQRPLAVPKPLVARLLMVVRPRASSLASIPPVLHRQHDVSDINVVVVVDIEAESIAILAQLTVPADGDLHEVHDVHTAIAIEIPEDP